MTLWADSETQLKSMILRTKENLSEDGEGTVLWDDIGHRLGSEPTDAVENAAGRRQLLLEASQRRRPSRTTNFFRTS